MFYPADSLKRGGRFYLIWVADSWPLRFATITHRQLYSTDIRQICDDLLEVIMKESGYASARFSLRLSSQLMRGLVRFYNRKITVFLCELCMMNANIIKHTNKKWIQQDGHPKKSPRRTKAQIREIPDIDEERVEERIRNSGNVVENIESITLKEPVLPEIQLPLEGFGEENPEQAMQLLLADQTVEVMLAANDGQLPQTSGLDLPGMDQSDKSDKSRLLRPGSLHMERLSEHDTTLFKKSFIAPDAFPMDDLDKDAPQIPEPVLEIPIPSPEKPAQNAELEPEDKDTHKEVQQREDDENADKIVVELQDLEVEQTVKRKRAKKLIVDKITEIGGKVFRSRLENVKCELRCEDFSEDVVDANRLPYDVFFQRPSTVGWRAAAAAAAPALLHMFRRNLGVVGRPHRDVEIERMLVENMRDRRKTNYPLVEARKRIPASIQEVLEKQPVLEARVSEQIDISELPTQVLPRLSVDEGTKRRSSTAPELSPMAKKKRRQSGFVSFRLSQQMALESAEVENMIGKPTEIPNEEPIIPQEIDQPPMGIETSVALDKEARTSHTKDLHEQHVSQMLEEAGLADAKTAGATQSPLKRASENRRPPSEGSTETQLGSLDRTLVDLGESEKTTDSQRLLKKEWGTEGTMLKVLRLRRLEERTLNFCELISLAPPEVRNKHIAATCFTSLLKLHKHDFVVLHKNSATLEIDDIRLGNRILV